MPLRYRDSIVFHVPKTGGTSVAAALLKRKHAERWGGSHDLWNKWKGEIKQHGLNIVGTIRDPWTRYGSLYLHARRKGLDARLAVWGGGSTEFRDVLYGWTHPHGKRIARELGTIWHPGSARQLLQSRLGLYSFGVLRCYGPHWHTLMACDRLDEAVPEVLGVKYRGRHNAAVRTDYPAMYDDEMIGWVAESEKAMIERHGFVPWEPSPSAVWLSE